MGWSCGNKPSDVRAVLLANVTFQTETERTRPLDIAILRLHTAYIAVETTVRATGETYVWAAVALMKFYRNGPYDQEFCVKWLDETMGPVEDECPERILKQLTPTPRDNEYSTRWRRRCWDRVHARKAVKARVGQWKQGQMLEYVTADGQGLSFGHGSEVRVFRLLNKRRGLFSSPGYDNLFRIPRPLWVHLRPLPATYCPPTAG